MTEEIEVPFIKRKNRKWMAWISIICIILLTVALMFWVDIKRLEKLDNMMDWAYISFFSIVGAYMGLTSFEKIKGGK